MIDLILGLQVIIMFLPNYNTDIESQYLAAMRYILTSGDDRIDRTKVGIRSVFGIELRCDLADGYPLLTTKKCHFKSIVTELLWFISGQTNIAYLQDHGVRIWNEWADENGDLGPVYGYQWRHWDDADGRSIDQLKDVIEQIKTNPYSRRHIVSAWNVGQLKSMALPPCHLLFQFYVSKGRLSLKLIQRSADFFLGVPFNIASYALLIDMVATQCNLKPGHLIWSGGDCHIYHNHFEQVKLQLSRKPYDLPTLEYKPSACIFDYQVGDFSVPDYQAHPRIKAPIAV